jgi:hypothetical protein
MHRLKTLLGTGALAAILAAGGIVATTPTASAEVACNSYGEFWHVGHRYNTYPCELGIRFFGDDWRKSHEHDRRFTGKRIATTTAAITATATGTPSNR